MIAKYSKKLVVQKIRKNISYLNTLNLNNFSLFINKNYENLNPKFQGTKIDFLDHFEELIKSKVSKSSIVIRIANNPNYFKFIKFLEKEIRSNYSDFDYNKFFLDKNNYRKSKVDNNNVKTSFNFIKKNIKEIAKEHVFQTEKISQLRSKKIIKLRWLLDNYCNSLDETALCNITNLSKMQIKEMKEKFTVHNNHKLSDYYKILDNNKSVLEKKIINKHVKETFDRKLALFNKNTSSKNIKEFNYIDFVKKGANLYEDK